MATKNSEYYSEEDFDVILAALEEEDEAFEKELRTVVEDVSKCEVTCEICQKKCKSRSGLKRHQTVQHVIKENRDIAKVKILTIKEVLTKEQLKILIQEIRIAIIDNGCYPETVKVELSNEVTFSDKFFDEISTIYNAYHKNGNTEKLYTSIFSKPILNAQTYFGLGRDVSTLIVQKLADRFTALRKELTTESLENGDDFDDSEPWVPLSYRPLPELSEMEKHGLRYIGGYCYKKLYKKMKNSKDWKSLYNQMAIAFLEAGRDNDVTDTFLDEINRGGLWKVSTTAEDLFLIVEAIFRRNTSQKGLRSIDTKDILFSL
ncbi:uncharacterized protein [Clytia hemisphaerica]|uniref:uncharacterized protein n=1 Tax=Clytia hemisphaerica TaxID=252671 RepID=UPI0034D79AE0